MAEWTLATGKDVGGKAETQEEQMQDGECPEHHLLCLQLQPTVVLSGSPGNTHLQLLPSFSKMGHQF